jgi:hypothetical protein
VTTNNITDGSTRTATYVAPGHTLIEAFTTAPPLHWVRFEGINTADTTKPMVVDIYRTRLKMPSELSLVGDTLSSLSVTGRILYDSASTRYLGIRVL